MGIEFASTEPLNPFVLRTLAQSCVDIRNLRTSRAYEQHALDVPVCFLLQLVCSDRRSYLLHLLL